MSKAAKILAGMRNNPAGDWTIADVRVVAGKVGLVSRRPGKGSSHETFSYPAGGAEDRVTIPDHGRIKSRYIVLFVALLDRLHLEP